MIKSQKPTGKPDAKADSKATGKASNIARPKPHEETKNEVECFHTMNCSTGENSNVQRRPTIRFNTAGFEPLVEPSPELLIYKREVPDENVQTMKMAEELCMAIYVRGGFLRAKKELIR